MFFNLTQLCSARLSTFALCTRSPDKQKQDVLSADFFKRIIIITLLHILMPRGGRGRRKEALVVYCQRDNVKIEYF